MSGHKGWKKQNATSLMLKLDALFAWFHGTRIVAARPKQPCMDDFSSLSLSCIARAFTVGF